jgi:hypothetical protein
MRYFTDGLLVARVHTTADFGEEFLAARGEVFNIATDDWVQDRNAAGEIVLTGDWESLTQAEAEQTIADRQAHRRTG